MTASGKRSYRLAVLPGDFIGPEVVEASLEALDAVAQRHDLEFEYNRLPFGGAALDETGVPFPDETRSAVTSADAGQSRRSGSVIW